MNEDQIFEIASNSGALDCLSFNSYHEIISEKEDFYKIKSEFENKIDKLTYSGIEWRPSIFLNLNKDRKEKNF